MMGSAERLMELECVNNREVAVEPLDRAVYTRMDAICGENLSFGYDRDEIFSQLSFRLEKGSFAVVTGPSGKGKSTLLKLLLGVFRPTGGALYLDCGGEIISLERSARRLFAYVPQGNLIFSGTIRENLLIAAPNATEEAIAQATYISAMDDFLSQLPQGLDTVLGESGAGLSEGQSQRLAIARAVLGGAPIVLLDEATSALDEDTEKRVLQRIRELPDRTCIAVTHRPAAREMADQQLDMV
jgi:ATP-binding cassette subfamily B protein